MVDATDNIPGVAGRRRGVVNVVAAASFAIGGSLFALGAFLAQQGVGDLSAVNVTYLVGGFFFSLGGYLSVVLANLHDHTGRVRWWRMGSRGGLAWRSAAILFVGTLFFAISLIAAFAEGLTPRQSDGWIWIPDIVGCLCFLASGHFAMLDVCGGRVGLRLRDGDWWIVAINQLGSVLFFLAGLSSFVRPATSEAINEGLVNWGTFAGAVCFAVAGLAQIGRGTGHAAPAPIEG
jgi:hypothetical protein